MSNTVQTESVPERQKQKAFNLRQRVSIWCVAKLSASLIRTFACTLKYECSAEDDYPDPVSLPESTTISAFWHRCLFSALYFFRERGVAVMTSRSYDGEYITSINTNLGYASVRGSSSRGAVSALLGMKKVIEEHGVAAFAADGPRGPLYVAKPGPVLLSKKTGAPIRCFYVAVSKGWTIRSWDGFVIPRPFARAYVRWSSEIFVPADADESVMSAFQAEMQTTLERVRDFAQSAIKTQL